MKAALTITLSFILAFILLVVPLPGALAWFRPPFVLLVMIYWAMAMPQYCGVWVASLVGLIVDSLSYSMLGKHFLAYGLCTAIVAVAYKRIRVLDVLQQSAAVFLLLGLSGLLGYWFDVLMKTDQANVGFMLSAFVGALAWPLTLSLLRRLRRSAGMMKQLV